MCIRVEIGSGHSRSRFVQVKWISPRFIKYSDLMDSALDHVC